MKVKELIEELKKHDENANVIIKVKPKNAYCTICLVAIKSIKQRGSIVIEGE